MSAGSHQARPPREGIPAPRATGSWHSDPWLYLAVVGALVLRFWNLGEYELWADELHTHLLAASRLDQIVSPRFMAPYMPVYFLMGHVQSWLGIASELGLRALPAFMGAALVPVLYTILRRGVSVTAGRFAAAMAAVHPLLIYFSREHRMYSLYVLSLALAILAVMRWRDRERGGGAVVASTCLAAMTFPLALWFLSALPALIRPGEWRRMQRLAILLLPSFVLGGSWIMAALPTISDSANAYYALLDPGQVLAAIKIMSIGNFSMEHRDLAPAAWLALLLLGPSSLLAFRRRGSGPSQLVWFTAFFLVIPFALIWILQHALGAIYNYKSFQPASLGIIILASVGLASLPRKPGTLGLILYILLALWIDRALLDRTHTFNWNTARTESYVAWKRAIETQVPPADGMLLLNHVVALQAMHYGSPSGMRIYADRDAHMLAYPAANRPSMAAIYDRHRVLDRSPRDTAGLALIAYPSSSFDPASWPALREISRRDDLMILRVRSATGDDTSWTASSPR